MKGEGIFQRQGEISMKNLLHQIVDGKTVFEPEDGQIIEFQKTVHALRHAYQRGYIGFFKAHRESKTGNHYYEKVVINNVTNAGKYFLNAH